MPRSRKPPPAPERNGWRLYAWTEFARQLAALRSEVEELHRRDPSTYERHPKTKLLAAVRRLILEVIPRDPGAEEFRQGSTLGPAHRHWFRAKFSQRFRLFYRFHSARKIIIYTWMNDESTLRKHGSKRDPYSLFRTMIERGTPPSDFDDLLRQSGSLNLPD